MDHQTVKEFKKWAQMRHETLNNHLKHFEVLNSMFQHPKEKDLSCFDAVCIITQYKMESGKGLFDI